MTPEEQAEHDRVWDEIEAKGRRTQQLCQEIQDEAMAGVRRCAVEAQRHAADAARHARRATWALVITGIGMALMLVGLVLAHVHGGTP